MIEINQYYNNYDEENRLVKDNAHLLEFITTTKFLDRYISGNTSVLEIGAGTGRYSFHFLKNAKEVVATDVFHPHVEKIKEKAKLLDPKMQLKLNAYQADARDLSFIKDHSYDLVLCLGPFYHLKADIDRRDCLNELVRVLKKGGILAIAYCNRMSKLVNNIDKFEDLNFKFESILEYGNENEIPFYYSYPNEIESYAQKYNIKKLHHIATDGIGYTLKDSINKLSEDGFKKWTEFHLKTCEDESIRAYSMHGLFVGHA